MADDDEATSAGLTRKRLLRDAGVLGVALVGGGSLGAGRGLAEITGFTSSAAAATALVLTPSKRKGPTTSRSRRSARTSRSAVPASRSR